MNALKDNDAEERVKLFDDTRLRAQMEETDPILLLDRS